MVQFTYSSLSAALAAAPMSIQESLFTVKRRDEVELCCVFFFLFSGPSLLSRKFLGIRKNRKRERRRKCFLDADDAHESLLVNGAFGGW